MEASRAIYLHALSLRYGQGIAEKLIKQSAKFERAVIRAIGDFEEYATSADYVALSVRNERNRAVKALFADIDAAFMEVSNEAGQTVSSELTGMAGEVYKDESAASLPVLGVLPVAGIIGLYRIHADRIKAAIVDAQDNGRDLRAAIRGTKEQQRKDGAMFAFRSALEREASTLAAGTSANAIMAKNAGSYEVILATLDHRTCLTCAPLDGTVHKTGKGPRPPFHNRCRCVRVPWLGEITERPFVDDERSVKNIPKSERAGKIGQVRLSFEDWMETLSPESQENILGPARYALWKSGQAELGDFSAGQAGPILSIDDLRKKLGD
jgi:hypothetical protein